MSPPRTKAIERPSGDQSRLKTATRKPAPWGDRAAASGNAPELWATVGGDRDDDARVPQRSKGDEATVRRPRQARDVDSRQRAPVLAVGIHHRQLRRVIGAALAKGERDAALASRFRLGTHTRIGKDQRDQRRGDPDEP